MAENMDNVCAARASTTWQQQRQNDRIIKRLLDGKLEQGQVDGTRHRLCVCAQQRQQKAI